MIHTTRLKCFVLTVVMDFVKREMEKATLLNIRFIVDPMVHKEQNIYPRVRIMLNLMMLRKCKNFHFVSTVILKLLMQNMLK